jgi:hypothetical protein
MLPTMAGEVQRTPNWWDEVSGPFTQPAETSSLLGMASDRLSLATIAQDTHGRDPMLARQLGQWCIALKGQNPDLATVMAVLQGLDRLDRQACEPQVWQHLQAAEMVVAAYVAKVQGG